MTRYVSLYRTQTGGSWNCRGQLVEDGAADINCRLLATGKFCVDIFARMHAAARWYPHSPCRDWRKDALSLLACKNLYYATFWCFKVGPSTVNIKHSSLQRNASEGERKYSCILVLPLARQWLWVDGVIYSTSAHLSHFFWERKRGEEGSVYDARMYIHSLSLDVCRQVTFQQSRWRES